MKLPEIQECQRERVFVHDTCRSSSLPDLAKDAWIVQETLRLGSNPECFSFSLYPSSLGRKSFGAGDKSANHSHRNHRNDEE
jgi:hypothetical protein